TLNFDETGRSLMPEYFGLGVISLAIISTAISFRRIVFLCFPAVILIVFSVIQGAFLLSGFLSNREANVGLWHIMALILFLVAVPALMGVLSLRISFQNLDPRSITNRDPADT
ncbi:MAG: hypothetical protein AAFR69_12735, partial [Pseudomonadota bacterium]